MKASEFIPLGALTAITAAAMFFSGKATAAKSAFGDVFGSFWLDLGYNIACCAVLFGFYIYVVNAILPVGMKHRSFVRWNLLMMTVAAAILFRGLWLDDFIRELVGSGL